MQKAIYAPELERHFALNKTHYCHFTSPIRRYPDLTVHRLLEQLDQGKRPRNDLGELQVLGEHCSAREQHAAEAERELNKLKLLNFLAGRIGMQMPAVITGVEEYGLFAQGVDLPAEGLIPVSSLQEDYYAFDAASHSLVGRRQGNRFRLGDLVNVEVFRVDPDRRELDFRLVARTGRTGDRAPAAGSVRSASRTGRRQARSGRDSGRRRRRSG